MFFYLNNYNEELLRRFNISIEEMKLLEQATKEIDRINNFEEIIHHLTMYTPIYEPIISKICIGEVEERKILRDVVKQIEENFKTITLKLEKFKYYIRNYKIEFLGKVNSKSYTITRPSIVIRDEKNKSVEFRLLFSTYSKLLALILDIPRFGISSNRKEAMDLKEYIHSSINYREELKYVDRIRIQQSFKYSNMRTISQSIFTVEDIESEVFTDIFYKYINKVNEFYERLEDSKKDELEIYLSEDDIKDSYKYDNDYICDIEGCSNKSEYAVFEYNKNTNERHFTKQYICRNHVYEYENNKDNNDNIIRQYYKKNFKTEKKLLKTISEKEEEDYINVTKDIDAFVELITNENLSLPMNIGVFGDWGSGKTFFIDSIINKIKVHENILSISFNAWNYYDSNITTNLVYNIFKSLYEKIGNYENILKNSPYHDDFEKYKNNREEKIKEIQNEIKELENKNNINELIEHIKPFISESDFDKIQSIKSDYILFNDISKHIKGIINKNMFERIIKNILKYSVIAGCIFIILKYVLKWDALIVDTVSIIGLVLPILKNYMKESNNLELKEGISKFNIGLKQKAKEANKIEKLKQSMKSLESENDDSIEKDFVLNIIKDKCNKYDEKIGFISTIKEDIDSLKFLKKSEKDNYLQNIKIDKIVLIIDDLDRCPAKKVVEVLQTIQLLLSTEMFIVIISIDTKWVNNCIASVYSDMLEDDKHLFAINYLEKIIHIPFWTEPLDNENSFKFIEKMCEKTNVNSFDDKKNEVTKESNEKEYDSNSINKVETEKVFNSTENEDSSEIYVDEDTTNELKEDKEILVENINLTKDDLDILNDMKFLLENISPRKIKRFFNTILLIKLKYRSDRSRYKKLLFIATSIVLKPYYSCTLYRNILISSDEVNTLGKFIKNYIDNKTINDRDYKYLVDFSKYIEQNSLTDLEIDKFKRDIHEAARYTYYYEEIFKDSSISE